MKFILILAVFICTNAFAIQKELAAFSTLVVNGNISVRVVQSDKHYVEIADHGDLDLSKMHFNYKFKGSELNIRYDGSLIKGLDIEMVIYCVELDGVEAKTGAEISIGKTVQFKSNKISFSAFAGGKISVTTNCLWINAEVNQGGSLHIEGNTDLLDATVTTGGTIGTSFLKAKKVNAEVKLGGEIICFASELLNAKVTSGGTISYKGNPEINQKIVLGGKIEKL